MADLNFLNIDNCDLVTFNTPSADLQFIEYITGGIAKDFTNVDKYTVTYSNNCCTEVTTDIAPKYDLVPSIAACDIGSNTYTIQLDGIHGDLISTFLLGIDPTAPAAIVYTNTAGVVTFDLTLVPGTVTSDITIVITTISGFEYTLTFTVTQNANPLLTCTGVISNIAVVWPDLPDNIVEVPTINPEEELSLNELMSVTTILPGTYQVIICEVYYDATSTCIQNHVFIDCGTLKCQVINKWVTCIDSNIMDYYNALVWSNDCTDTITYNEICAIYEILDIILASDACYGMLDDCNCMDAETVANKLSPIRIPSVNRTSSCGCSS